MEERVEYDDGEFVERDDAHPGQKKMPVIRGMGELILSRFKSVVLNALNIALKDGTLAEMIESEILMEQIDEFYPSDISFYRKSRYEMEADVRFWVQLELKEETFELDAGVTLYVDVRTWYCECLELWDTVPDRKQAWKLDDSLVPYIPSSMKETRADQIWLRYMECGLFDPQSRAPVLLAYEMGMDVLVTKDPSLDSVFILVSQNPPSVISAIGEDGKTAEHEIKKDTLVLNIIKPDGRADDLEVFEQIVRYEWHYMFLRLQELSTTQPEKLPREWVPEDRRVSESLKIALMQARRGAYSLMIPSDFFREYVRDHARKAASQKRFFDYSNHAPAILEDTAKMMRKEYPSLKLCWIKTRYLHMGDIAARGIFNSTDGHYMDAFDFMSEEIASGIYTPAIGYRARVLSMFCREAYFRQIMETGEYVFADGLVIRNHPDFVMETEQGLRPTSLGNMAADQCSLWFGVKWVSKYRTYSYSFKKEDYERAEVRQNAEIVEARKARLRRLEAIGSVHEMIADLIGEEDERVAKRSTIPVERIKALREREMERYRMDEMVALCLGLQLEPPVSYLLIRKAGLEFNDEDKGKRRAIICCLFRESVPDLQRYLENERLNHDKIPALDVDGWRKEKKG